MLGLIIFVLSSFICYFLLSKSKNKPNNDVIENFFISFAFSIIIALFLTIIVYGVLCLEPYLKTETVLVERKFLIEQKYKNKEEYYSIYNAKNEEGEKRYYYFFSKNGIYQLDSVPADETTFVYSKKIKEVRKYESRYTNKVIEFLFSANTIPKYTKGYIIYSNDRNINLKEIDNE